MIFPIFYLTIRRAIHSANRIYECNTMLDLGEIDYYEINDWGNWNIPWTKQTY